MSSHKWGFQHTAARRRLVASAVSRGFSSNSFNTQPPEGGWHRGLKERCSTSHSFNTQPPEGGWLSFKHIGHSDLRFQHTAARRRLGHFNQHFRQVLQFQHTAARRRLGMLFAGTPTLQAVSTHSRPKAAGPSATQQDRLMAVSTHSRPKAAGWTRPTNRDGLCCFNTQPPEGGWAVLFFGACKRAVSTHSRPKAAGVYIPRFCEQTGVSTHSRPKAAGWCFFMVLSFHKSFNTQPPEGGWGDILVA